MKKTVLYKALILFISLLAVSCQNDDAPVVYEEGTNEYVNQWMYEQMKQYYYWNGKMPDNVDLSLPSTDYFKKLLSADDRFSYAMHSSIPETAPQSLRKSFGFDISFVEYQGQVLAAVLYVLDDSPAKRAGLKRGQYITQVNGIQLGHSNFDNAYHDLIFSDNALLTVKNYTATSGFSTAREITIPRGFTFSQPVLTQVILDGNDKTGYIAIPHFDVGMAQSLLQVFEEFKDQSVNKIVVDLRYNGGGDVSSAAALSIILAPDIHADDLFITFTGNQNGGIIQQSFKEALEMNETQTTFQALRATHPAINKLYILCGSHTASASEIIINNLKPFMEVITIGEKTIGKDVAGFPIVDDRISGQQGWILYPSIYKLLNANNEGNYSEGIKPAIEIDELQQIEIFPLGNPGELLLQQALNTGSNDRKINSPLVNKLQRKHYNFETDPLLQINP